MEAGTANNSAFISITQDKHISGEEDFDYFRLICDF